MSSSIICSMYIKIICLKSIILKTPVFSNMCLFYSSYADILKLKTILRIFLAFRSFCFLRPSVLFNAVRSGSVQFSSVQSSSVQSTPFQSSPLQFSPTAASLHMFSVNVLYSERFPFSFYSLLTYILKSINC